MAPPFAFASKSRATGNPEVMRITSTSDAPDEERKLKSGHYNRVVRFSKPSCCLLGLARLVAAYGSKPAPAIFGSAESSLVLDSSARPNIFVQAPRPSV